MKTKIHITTLIFNQLSTYIQKIHQFRMKVDNTGNENRKRPAHASEPECSSKKPKPMEDNQQNVSRHIQPHLYIHKHQIHPILYINYIYIYISICICI